MRPSYKAIIMYFTVLVSVVIYSNSKQTVKLYKQKECTESVANIFDREALNFYTLTNMWNFCKND